MSMGLSIKKHNSDLGRIAGKVRWTARGRCWRLTAPCCNSQREVLGRGVEERELVEADLNASVKRRPVHFRGHTPCESGESTRCAPYRSPEAETGKETQVTFHFFETLHIAISTQSAKFSIRFNVLCWLIKHCSASKAFRAEDTHWKGFRKMKVESSQGCQRLRTEASWE